MYLYVRNQRHLDHGWLPPSPLLPTREVSACHWNLQLVISLLESRCPCSSGCYHQQSTGRKISHLRFSYFEVFQGWRGEIYSATSQNKEEDHRLAAKVSFEGVRWYSGSWLLAPEDCFGEQDLKLSFIDCLNPLLTKNKLNSSIQSHTNMNVNYGL